MLFLNDIKICTKSREQVGWGKPVEMEVCTHIVFYHQYVMDQKELAIWP